MGKTKQIACAALIALFFSSSGCAKHPVSFKEGPRSYTAEDYPSVLRSWTRKTSHHSLDEMDNVLTVTSTYQSWDFRWAYVTRYARDYRLTAAEKNDLLKRSLDTSQQLHEFYVALFGQDPDYADLHEEDPVWIVRLVDETGNETKPLNIDKINDPGALELSYYPYTSSFRTVYRLSFPKNVGSGQTIDNAAKWFGLRFSGVQGAQTLKWELAN